MRSKAIDAALIQARLEMCRRSFRYFLRYWRFNNRETGKELTFASLWPGQDELVSVMEQYQWIFALKAGKLGFTELECAFDGWKAIFGHENARIHLFSKDLEASRGLLEYVRHGLTHLPKWFGVEVMKKAPGGDKTGSLIIRCNWMEAEDRRTIVSYPAVARGAAIDRSALHTHVDELSHMADPRATWNSVSTTVSPQIGTIHIVTRGAGADVYTAELWEAAEAANPELWGTSGYPYPFFAGYDKRPDRDARVKELAAASGTFTTTGLAYFMPETAEDALMGDEITQYIDINLWDSLEDPDLPPLLPGDRTPGVLSLDAAVTNDCFGATFTTRHPGRKEDPAIRLAKKWSPHDFPENRNEIDFEKVEEWILIVCFGACGNLHPRGSAPLHPDCESCRAGEVLVKPFNVIQICYDSTQLEDMMMRLRKRKWCERFDQGGERLISDGMMRRLAVTRRLAHSGNPDLREHIKNAAAKHYNSEEEDTKIRIVKKKGELKIDLAVSASMGVKRILDLNV